MLGPVGGHARGVLLVCTVVGVWRIFAAPCKQARDHIIHFHTYYTIPALTRVNHGPVTPPPLRTHERIYHAMAVHRAMNLQV